jgi:integrase
MKVKFYLSRPDGESETAIFTRVSHNGNQWKIYTGVSVLPKYWNPKEHRVRQSPAYRQYASINAMLDKVKGLIESVYYDYKKEHFAEPSPATFRKLIDIALGKTKETKLSFLEYFQDFIDRTKAGQRRTPKGKIIKDPKAYIVTRNNLQDFAKGWHNKLDFDTIDIDFYNDYMNFLKRKSLSENTIGREIRNLKAVLNEATERGQNTNMAFRSKSFIKPSEEVDNIALTDAELKEIQAVDLSDAPHLDRVRDLFLIGAYTGLRYSDFTRLTPDNIKGGLIEIKQQKTGKTVAIPVHSVVRSIFEKYGGNLPASISNQKFNEYLKDVAKRVPGLKEPATKTRTQGGMKVTVNIHKWELVSTHTARRSFATNNYLQGMPTITIMAITGHRTEQNFLKYIKITPREHAKIMAKYWSRSKMKAV